jgi:DNA-directed RNA polymerase specialized sigma24 family protein
MARKMEVIDLTDSKAVCSWRTNLPHAAFDRVLLSVNPAHYEMFHLHVVQGLTARETAHALDTTRAAVYLAKRRVGTLVKAELKRLGANENIVRVGFP